MKRLRLSSPSWPCTSRSCARRAPGARCAPPGCSRARRAAAISFWCGKNVNTLRNLGTSASSRYPELVEGVRRVRSAVSQTAPLSVLPNLLPSALVTSGAVSPNASTCAASRRIRSMPATMLPHWSEPADLHASRRAFVQVQEVVRLQQHVAELGVADALLAALQALAHRVLLDHHVDREVLADVAQHLDERRACRASRRCSTMLRGVRRRLEVEQALEDPALAPRRLRSTCSRVSSWRSASLPEDRRSARCRRPSSRPACARRAESAQQHDRHQVADGERVRGRVEAAVDHARASRDALSGLSVGLLVQKASPGQVFEEHEGAHTLNLRAPRSNPSRGLKERLPRARARPVRWPARTGLAPG